jgi:hypothetical protein
MNEENEERDRLILDERGLLQWFFSSLVNVVYASA